jgi:hypothetical protein
VPRELLVLVPMVLLVPRGPPELVLLEPQVLLEQQELAQQVQLALEVLSPLAPMLRTCCLLRRGRSPPLMRLPIRSSSGTTAQVS